MNRLRCTCGHQLREHDHYRAGLDCSACECGLRMWRRVHPVEWRRWRRYRRTIASAERELRRG